MASPAITPAVLGVFALIYIVIAFYNDESLITLLALTRNNSLLIMLLACIPLNIAAMIVLESVRFVKKLRTVPFSSPGPVLGADEESVELTGVSETELLEKQLAQAGYQYRQGDGYCFAWKGVSIFPARLLFLLGVLLLFCGILISTTTRTSLRAPVIEGEQLPEAMGSQGWVEQILLQDRQSLFLARTLRIKVALGEGPGGIIKDFSLYPPGSVNGIYLYPRYLGLAPFVEFTPPEPAFALSSFITLMIYPPGKEDSAEIPGSPYRIVFALVEPKSPQDPYISGNYVIHFRVMKEKTQVAEGTVPVGAKVNINGYSLSFPTARRVVVTDLVRDSGLSLIWGAGLLLVMACAVYLPIRLFVPRREMLFLQSSDTTRALSRAEGWGAAHSSLFHGILDAMSHGK